MLGHKNLRHRGGGAGYNYTLETCAWISAFNPIAAWRRTYGERLSHHHVRGTRMLASTIVEPTALIDLDETYLPVGRMRQITRVTSMDEMIISGEVDLGAEHWVWPEHFPGDPVFPGTLMIEAAGQLLALWAWAQGARGRPRLVRTEAEFHNPVGAGTSHLELQAQVRRRRNLYFGTIQVSSRELKFANVDAVLAILPSLP